MTFKFYLRMVAAAIATLLLAVGCSDDKTDDPNPNPDPDPTVDCTFDLEVYDITASSAFGKAHPSDATVTYYLGVVEKNLFDTFASDKAFQTNDVETMQKLANEDNIGLSEYLEARISVAEVPTLFSGLDASTDYYLYAYGITSNGDITTDLTKKEFTTSDSTRPMTFDIKVTGITPYGANVAVQPSGKSTYYYDVFEKAEMDKFANDAAIIAELVKSADFESRLVTGEKSYTYGPETEALQPKTEYYAYAFEYGNPSLEAPEIKKVAFTTKSDDPFNPTYASWLGKWRLVSVSSFVKNSPLTIDIEITQKVAGKSYNVSGWSINRARLNYTYEAAYASSQIELQDGTIYPAGSLLILNQQEVGAADDEGYVPTLLGYHNKNNKVNLVTGQYYSFSGVLTADGEATVTCPVLKLDDGSTPQMVGGDVFALNLTAGKVATYFAAEGYTDEDYPIGPYTLTRIAEVDPPTPPVGNLTFGIALSNITETTVSVAITPSNNTDSYYFDLVPSSFNGKSDAELISAIEEAYAQRGLINLVSTGPDSYDWSGLTAGATYYVVAFGYDASGATTSVTRKEVILTGGGGEPGDGPELQLSARAGDVNGADTDTKGYIVATSPTAVAAKYGRWPKSVVDEAGMSIDAIVTQYGVDGDAQFIEYLNVGLGLTFNELDPATTYTVIFKVTDAAGKSTVKSVDFTTTSGGGGEASDAYKAWLGTWTVTSTSSEVNNKPITFDVTIAENVADATFNLTGWSIWKVRTSPVPVKFKNGNLVIPGETFLAEIDLNGTDNGKCKIYYTNSSLVTLLNGQSGRSIVSGDFDAITATMGADKASATTKEYSGKLSNGGTFDVTGVDFFAEATVKGETNWYNVYDPAPGFTANDIPVGPFTLVKKSNNTAPMGVPAQYNLSSVLTASNYLVPTKRIAAVSSRDAANTALMVNSQAVVSRSGNAMKNLAKLMNPASANDMLTLGSPMRYMTAVETVMQTGSVKNLLRPIKKAEAAYKLGTVRNE